MIKKDFLSISQLTPEEIHSIFELSTKFKDERKKAIKDSNYTPTYSRVLTNLSAALIFWLPSTRTITSFTEAWELMGGRAQYVDVRKTHFDKSNGEPLSHVATVYGRYKQCLFIRTVGKDSHNILKQFAQYSNAPVINAMDINYHPMQGLTDCFTLQEKLGSLKEKQITHFGYGNNNVTHSLMIGATLFGAKFVIVCPEEGKISGKPFSYTPLKKVVNTCNTLAKKYNTGGKIYITHDINDKIVEHSDVITTDAHSIMGYSDEDNQVLKKNLSPYKITRSITERIKNPEWLFIHCMPVHQGIDHQGEEVDIEIANDSKHSILFDEAENRLHIQAGLLWYMTTITPNPFREDIT